MGTRVYTYIYIYMYIYTRVIEKDRVGDIINRGRKSKTWVLVEIKEDDE